MKKLVQRFWSEPAFCLGALAALADGVLVLGAGLPAWVAVIVHVVQGVATRSLVSPAKTSGGKWANAPSNFSYQWKRDA